MMRKTCSVEITAACDGDESIMVPLLETMMFSQLYCGTMM